MTTTETITTDPITTEVEEEQPATTTTVPELEEAPVTTDAAECTGVICGPAIVTIEQEPQANDCLQSGIPDIPEGQWEYTTSDLSTGTTWEGYYPCRVKQPEESLMVDASVIDEGGVVADVVLSTQASVPVGLPETGAAHDGIAVSGGLLIVVGVVLARWARRPQVA